MTVFADSSAVVKLYSFEPGHEEVHRVESTDFDRAAELVALRGLRAYDAVQLAGALKVSAYDATCQTLATFDVELRRAAEQEGLGSLPTS